MRMTLRLTLSGMISALEIRQGSKITNIEQILSRLEDQFDTLKKENYDKEDIDKQHQQLQVSITQAHNYTKSLEQDTMKVATKIIEDAKNDNRILEQKVTKTINNNTKLQTRMQGIEKESKKTSNFEEILRKHSEKIGIMLSIFCTMPKYRLNNIHDFKDYIECKHFSPT